MKLVIMMFVWVGGVNGGPFVIDGWMSMDNCVNAIPAVTSAVAEVKPFLTGPASAVCREVKR